MADESMVERVARALCVRAGHDPDEIQYRGTEEIRSGWEAYADDVRAAIRALREPSEAMVSSGMAEIDHDGAGDCWRAMIDAALGDADPPS